MDTKILGDSNNKCKYCTSFSFYYKLKLITPNYMVKELGIKFVPQIGKYCTNCGRWIKWVEQTSKLVDKFNQRLEGVKCG